MKRVFRTKSEKEQLVADFVESGMTNEINSKSNVQIEYDGFKITITELADISFFKDVLKAVRTTDV